MTLAASACEHKNIVPSKTYPDGSVDGKCTDCGDDTFPIRDVAYEEWKASGDAPKCGGVTEYRPKVLLPRHDAKCSNPSAHSPDQCYALSAEPSPLVKSGPYMPPPLPPPPRESPKAQPPAAPVSPPAPAAEAPKKWLKPCKARCALTGKQCELLFGHTVDHRHGRTSFRKIAYQGQTFFPHAAELEERAAARPDGTIPDTGPRAHATTRSTNYVPRPRRKTEATTP